MRNLVFLLLTCVLGISMYAQETPKPNPTPPSNAPVLTADQKNALMSLERQYIALAQQGQELGNKLKDLQTSFQKLSAEDCKSTDGKNYQVDMGNASKGDEPRCAEVQQLPPQAPVKK